jgi:hypothetical protein
MKKITLVLVGGTFLFVGFTTLPGTMSNGAPAASTGAPDEKHCSNSGCHSTFAPNTGTAELTVSVGNGITSYEPGKTYSVTVSITDAGGLRFGFQAVAINAENKNTGTIKITDEPRTQVIPGYGNMSDRKYATYTYEGTNAVQTGLGKWNFEWTAPQTNEGAVTLYFGSVSANNDGTDAGDHTYSKKIVLDAPSVSWSVYPNISSSEFRIQNSGAEIQQLKIFNASGEKVFEKKNMEPGMQSVELNQPNGVYFISTVQDGKTSVQKIVISR